MVGVAQSVRASDCGPEGRGFDSHRPPHTLDSKFLHNTAIFLILTKIFGILIKACFVTPIKVKSEVMSDC